MEGSAQDGIDLPRWQRLLLPGGMVDTGAGRRTLRDWVVDVLMLLIAVGVGCLVFSETAYNHSDVTVVLDIVLGIVMCVALWFRRSRPLEVTILALVASTVSALAAGPGLIAYFNASMRVPGRKLAWLVAGACVATVLFPILYPAGDPYVPALLVGLLINSVVLGWGLFVRVQRDLVRSLQDRAFEREAEHRLHVEQAREAERRRIAREMHDVLAHRVSLLSLHAGALEFRPDAPPEEIAQAAAVIRTTAHAALEELREVIGVLRESDQRAVEPPQPTLAQIPALVEESRAAGMRVRLRLEGSNDEALPVAVGRTAYRIVQEGLTNARKHAPGAAVDVAITDEGAEELVVTVATRAPVGVVAGSALPGAGTGLIGLTERVALAGGRLEHGPDASGDFVLRATLPRAT